MEEEKYEPTLIQKVYSSTCDLVSETAEYLASFSLGQAVLRQTDRALWTVEKCAEWSIPTQPQPNKQHHQNQNGTFGKPGPLIRPLPWIFFIPMLISLRCLRLSLSITSFLLGFESVNAISMVRFIQIRRRRIRALKFLGLRRIRQHKMAREHSAKNRMTIRERCYNIMSRAMCFRVTNSDMYEEITVKKEEEKQASPRVHRQRSMSGRDLKRKYIEILKNNYYDWEDVEDDEELIDRITQLAEDDMENEDEDFVPAEDSATEDDSMSDAEEDAVGSSPIDVDLASPSQTPPKPIQRLTSHSSLTNEIIEEENEESDSTTVSANSEDESSQNIERQETPPKPEIKTHLEPSSTSDEFFSPLNSIQGSPEPKLDPEINKYNNQNQNNTQSQKTEENKDSLNADNQVNSQNSHPITSRDTNHGVPGKNNTNSPSTYSPRMKKHKHRRRFANILRRKRK